jgi:uncharacterized DUF497 family protein
VGADWSFRGDYMFARHGVSPGEADEALDDPDALVFDPDYASQPGRSIRTIGYSSTAGRMLTVITVRDGDTVYGVNGWPANSSNVRRYREGDNDEP